MGEVGKHIGGLLSLETEKQREMSLCVCAPLHVCAGGKGNPGKKGSQEIAILQKRR